jgi:outer membrane protein OmpA-like peptidoglycan-associated protein/uncharacterized protein YidB (DUF937 family)
MVTFDNLADEIDARYCLGPKAAPLIEETNRLVSKQPGGIGGFLRKFRAAGFVVEVASWLGGCDPVPLSGQEVEQTLGSEVVSRIATKVGVSQRFARTILGYAIPNVVVLLAQRGAVSSTIRASASRFFGSAIRRSSSFLEEGIESRPEQIGASKIEDGVAAPVLGGLIIPCTTLLIMLGSLLGYFIGAGDRGVIQSSPISAQMAPVASLNVASMLKLLPFSNENYAVVPIAGSGATPKQSVPKFPVVYFVANSAEVLPSSKPLVRKAARLIKQLPAGTVVEIAGYTHNVGNPTTNMQLSQRRANAVREALVRAGGNPAMLNAKGYGGIVEGRSDSHRRNDRRAEFSINQR